MPALIEVGQEWVPGGAEDALLAEAAALVADATDGAEQFAETLALVTEGVRVRGTPAQQVRRARERDPRRAKFIRNAPKNIVVPNR